MKPKTKNTKDKANKRKIIIICAAIAALFVGIMLLLVLHSCGSDKDVTTPVISPALPPAPTEEAATPTPEPTSTPKPTPTIVPYGAKCPSGTHRYINKVVEPTCVSRGYTEHICRKCGDTYRNKYTEMSGHTYTTTIIPPTSTAQGYTLFTCSVCGSSYRDEYTDPTGVAAHTHSWKTIRVVDPTCTGQGYTEEKCSSCGLTRRSNYTHETGHSYKNTETPATCEEYGYIVHVCQRCGDRFTESRTQNPLGHDYEKTVVEVTCTEDGYVTYVCSRCGSHKSEDESHTAALGHEWGELKTVAATCTSGGYAVQTCSRCGVSTYSNETAALGHSLSVTSSKATCTSEGHYRAVCTRCGIVVDDYSIPALGHNMEFTRTVKATCESTGYDLYNCTRCDAVMRQNSVPATGHDMQLSRTVEPTCTEDGYDILSCANGCGKEEKGNTTMALGHNFASFVKSVSASCIEEGYDLYKCTRCDVTDRKNVTPVDKENGHRLDIDSRKEIPATCTTPSYEEFSCALCGEVVQKVEIGKPDGHKWAKPEFKWEQDHSECTLTVTCSTCGKTAEEKCSVTTGETDTEFTFTAKGTIDGEEFTETASESKEGHEHTFREDAITYRWSPDHTECTATYTCTAGDYSEDVELEVTITAQDPSCGRPGETRYVAAGELSGVPAHDEYVVKSAATGPHTVKAEDITFTWSENNTCKASFTCEVCGDEVTLDCSVAQTGHTSGSCGENEKYIYIAAVTVGETTAKDERTVEVSGTSPGYHDYRTTGNPDPKFSEDLTTCTFYLECQVCHHVEEIQVPAHADGSASTFKCEEGGTVAVKAELEYKYQVNQNTERRITGVARASVTRPAGHVGEWVIEREPACNQAGVRKIHCEFCGQDIEEPIPASTVRHTYRDEAGKLYANWEWAEDMSACTATFTCQVCGDVKVIECDVSQDSEDSRNRPASCTETGIVAYKAVAEIAEGWRFEAHAYLMVSATGHQGEWVQQTPPTCTGDGQQTLTCTVCGKQQNQRIPATGHEFSEDGIAVTWAEDHTTCTFDLSCQACEFEKTVKASGSGITSKVTDPTCSTDGLAEYHAEVTFETGSKEYTVSADTSVTTARFNHMVDGETAWEYSKSVEATCEDSGYDLYICRLCKAEDRRTTDPPSGHSYDPVTHVCSKCSRLDYEQAAQDIQTYACQEKGFSAGRGQGYDGTLYVHNEYEGLVEAGKALIDELTLRITTAGNEPRLIEVVCIDEVDRYSIDVYYSTT